MRLPHPISQLVSLRLINFLTSIAVISLLAVPVHAAQNNNQLTSSSNALKFGSVAVGQTETMIVTLTNNGASSVTLSEVNLSNAEFSASVGSLPAVLAPGQSVGISLTFAPTTRGWTRGNVAFVSNASNSTLTVELSGTGDTTPPIVASPASISFGTQAVGTVASVPLVFTNTWKVAVSLNGLQTSGTGFSVTGPTLPLSVPAGQSVTFTVAFAPLAAGTNGGSIYVQGPALTVPLAGIGSATVAGQLTVAPAALNFGNVTLGNSGNQAVNLSASGASVTVTSDASSSAQFALAGVSLPFTIPAGQTVAVDVVFTPTNSGTASGALSFASNAANTPPAEAVSGTGVAPVYTVGLSWNPSTSQVMGYNVYRGPATSGPFTKINTSLEGNTAYTDNTVTSGQTYYYVTTAVNSNNVESAPSTPPAQAMIP